MSSGSSSSQPAAPKPRFDVFLSHNSRDKDEVRAIADGLRARGVTSWLDERELRHGERWTEKLAEGLQNSTACAIFYGKNGRGAWHDMEQELALKLSVDAKHAGRHFGFIPVRLPGAPVWSKIDLPPWAPLFTWMSFAEVNDTQALDRLAQAIRGGAPPPSAPPDSAAPPYVGLRPLREEERAIYFGRDRYIVDLCERLRATAAPRFTALLGASGSGKSSLLHAGLLPRLREGLLEGSKDWTYVRMQPGLDALENLRAVLRSDAALRPLVDAPVRDPAAWLHAVALGTLARAADGARLVLIVDQFEEVFTSRPVEPKAAKRYDEEVWRPFIRNLLYAAQEPSGRVHVIVAMRRDFFPQFATDPESGPVLQEPERCLVVEAMDETELRYAIVKPAVARGMEFDEGLVEVLIHDFQVQPAGSLPFLQEALLRLWVKREGSRMTRQVYTEMGRLHGALNAHAEKVFSKLSAPGQALTRPLLLHLVRLSDDGGADTKRRMPLLSLPGGAPAIALAHALARDGARLVTLDIGQAGGSAETERAGGATADAKAKKTTSEGEDEQTVGVTVEIAHEALLGGWKMLKECIQENRGERLRLRRLEVVARAWQAGGEGKPGLLRGAELKGARRVTQRLMAEVDPAVAAFVVRSHSAGRWRVATLAALALLVAGVIGWLMLDNYAQPYIHRLRAALNNEQPPTDEYLQLRQVPFFQGTANRYLADYWRRWAFRGDQALGLLCVERAEELDPSGNHRSFGLDRLQAQVNESDLLLVSRDGRWLFYGEKDAVYVLDISTRNVLKKMAHPSTVVKMAVSEDDSRVLAADNQGLLQVWEVATGTSVGESIPLGEGGFPIAISRDGLRIAWEEPDKSVQVWDVGKGKSLVKLPAHLESWRPPLPPALRENTVPPLPEGEQVRPAVCFSRDGSRLLAVSSSAIQLWDVDRGQHVPSAVKPGSLSGSVDFGPQGGHFLTVADRLVQLWNAKDGTKVSADLRHSENVKEARFSSDESRVVTTCQDGTAHVWEVATGKELKELSVSGSWVHDAIFSPDDTRIITPCRGVASAQLWDGGTYEKIGRSIFHQQSINSARFSEDGRRFVTADNGNIVKVWNSETGDLLGEPLLNDDGVIDARFSPDGSRIITAPLGGKTVCVWDVTFREQRLTPLHHEAVISGTAFSPDGTRIIVGGGTKASIWNVATGKKTCEIPVEAGSNRSIDCVAFSYDGKSVLTGDSGREVGIWKAENGERQGKPFLIPGDPSVNVGVNGAAFSPDGRRIVTYTGSGMVWDVDTHERIGPDLGDESGPVAFSPDGNKVVIGGVRGTGNAWDIATGKKLSSRIAGVDVAGGRAFSPDRSQAVVVSDPGGASVVDTASERAVSDSIPDNHEILHAVFSPDGKCLVYITRTHVVIWEWNNGEFLVRHIYCSSGDGYLRGAIFVKDQGEWKVRVADQWAPNMIVVRTLDLQAAHRWPWSRGGDDSAAKADLEGRLGQKLEKPDQSVNRVYIPIGMESAR